MKQTTSNKTDSCQRGWRLLSIVAAYFMCSEILRPFLLKYLETAAYDKRRAFHGKKSTPALSSLVCGFIYVAIKTSNSLNHNIPLVLSYFWRACGRVCAYIMLAQSE